MLILYTTEDGRNQIQLRAKDQTVWLTQLEMAELFDATKQNISLHLKNLFEDGELLQDSVVKESLTTAADGKAYSTKLYNLDIRASEKRFYQKVRELFALSSDYDKTDQATQVRCKTY